MCDVCRHESEPLEQVIAYGLELDVCRDCATELGMPVYQPQRREDEP